MSNSVQQHKSKDGWKDQAKQMDLQTHLEAKLWRDCTKIFLPLEDLLVAFKSMLSQLRRSYSLKPTERGPDNLFPPIQWLCSEMGGWTQVGNCPRSKEDFLQIFESLWSLRW